jgi:hypothetical protein
MTTHILREDLENIDVPTGEYRPLDFFARPFNLPKDVLARIVDYVEPFEPREMCLWSREQIAEAMGQQGGPAEDGVRSR